MSKRNNVEDIDITKMTAEELQEFQQRVAELRREKIVKDLVKMKDEFVRYCQENHLDLTDAFELSGFTKGGMIRKTKAKYKDPITGKLWAGRGKTPNWYTERLQQGYTEEDLKP